MSATSALIVAGTLVLAHGVAQAQSCLDLSAKRDALSASSSELMRLRADLVRLEARAHDEGCTLGASTAADCTAFDRGRRALHDEVARMEAHAVAATDERNRIATAMRDNGCRSMASIGAGEGSGGSFLHLGNDTRPRTADGATGFSVLAGSYGASRRQPAPADAVIAPDRPQPALKRQAIQSSAGIVGAKGRAADPAPAAGARPASQASPIPNRPVRVVGPAFLPDPQEAIDLQAPARALAR